MSFLAVKIFSFIFEINDGILLILVAIDQYFFNFWNMAINIAKTATSTSTLPKDIYFMAW
ncbi:MAG: hypothetical protein DRR16_09420 [Candidatus Parabeggiatoa sp. nov. 3]|nr:MAG: hypothetical protein DRR00_15680 [Gammaproteobacteria bacterium]RKZ65708.1 MAG: hypothetical protein DRQ99_11950 [Gammaproteobacteria bacterium]RKZ86533.1 MAG: hypothetical protein DRR16_09420 [Gammaproteobacteria bacterium]